VSWGDWFFLASAFGVGMLFALLVGGTLLVGILTGALRELNRQAAEDECRRAVETVLEHAGGAS